MVYSLIKEQLLTIFGVFDISQWQYHAIDISTFILTCFFVLLFIAIPTYLLTWCFSMFDDRTPTRKRKRR